jgi:hypothetical protein
MLEAKDAYKRLEALKSKRSSWDSHWQDVGDYFHPNKNTVTREGSQGEKRTLHIYDSTGIKSNELLAGALHGMLTNPSSYWFEFTTGLPELDRQDDVRKWLQKTAHVCHEVMNNSNFQTEIHEFYLDLCSFGTASLFIERDDVNVVRFSTKHVKDCWIEENNKGQVDTVFYCFKWKPRQIIQEFGDKCPTFVFEKDKKCPEEEIELLQVVAPNTDYKKSKKLSVQGKKFISCTYIRDGQNDHARIEEKGFNNLPFAIARWSKGSGEVYGRSPAMICLSDVKMLQEMMKETIRAQQKANNPPLLVPDDGIIGSLRLTPGGINYYRAGNGDFIKPLQTEQNLLLSFETLKDVRERIRQVYYIDQLLLREGPQMTATEVMQRTEEQIRLLGPVLGRQHSETLRPTIERVYEIADEAKLIPPIPRALSGKRIDVKYRSMIAKAQLAAEANNLMRVVQGASPFLQLDPNARHVIDAEEGVRWVASLYGMPVELTRDKEAVENIKKGIAEAQAQAVNAAREQAAVEQVSKLTPAIKAATEAGAA